MAMGIMTRRRSLSSAVGVDLFAFMNIMVATIGVQTLLIGIIALQIRPGGQKIQFVPSGSGGHNNGKTANYILLQGNGKLDLLADGRRQSTTVGSPQLASFLDRVAKARDPQFLVIGVKPGTYPEFNLVRAQAEAKGIALGYEPLDPLWRVQTPPDSLGSVNP